MAGRQGGGCAGRREGGTCLPDAVTIKYEVTSSYVLFSLQQINLCSFCNLYIDSELLDVMTYVA